MADIGGIIAALGIGAVGGFSERTGELRESQRRSEFDAFNAVMQAAAAGSETEFFNEATAKAFKALGGREEAYEGYRQVAGLPRSQEQKRALVAEIIAKREQAKTKAAQAGVQQEAIKGVQPSDIKPAARVATALGPEAAAAQTAEREVAVKEQELPIKTRLADIQERQIALEEKLGPGKLDVQKQLVKVEAERNRIAEDKMRGDIGTELQTKLQVPVGKARAFADHLTGRKEITDKKLLEEVNAARAQLSDSTSILMQAHNIRTEADKILGGIQASRTDTSKRKLPPADIASSLSDFNQRYVQAIQLEAQVQPMTNEQALVRLRNTLRFYDPDSGSIVTFNEAIARGVDPRTLQPSPIEIGLTAPSASGSTTGTDRTKGFVGRHTGIGGP